MDGESKASGRKSLGPPSVRIIAAEAAARLFGAAPTKSRRPPAPDETGRITDKPRAPAD